MHEITVCPKCGVRDISDALGCRVCGAPLHHEHKPAGDGVVCAKCGARMERQEKLCNSCRTPVRDIIVSNLPEDLPAEECVHWSEGPASTGRVASCTSHEY